MGYAQAREYQPETGRFLSKDQDAYLHLGIVSSLNQYQYCLGDPINYTDPFGHDCIAEASAKVYETGEFWTNVALGVGATIATTIVGVAIAAFVIGTGGLGAIAVAGMVGGLSATGALALSDILRNEVSSKGEYITGAVIGSATEMISRGIQINKVNKANKLIEGGSNGKVRYREGRPVSPMDKTYEMALNPEYYAEEVSKKYGINLRGSGQQMNIIYDPNHLKGPGLSKQLDPTNIILGPQAFISEEELARTIAHELNHARSWLQGGIAPEKTARFAENALGSFIRGGR